MGSYEWLPALVVDASFLAYYPNHRVLWMCKGAIAQLPGGQPGGFNDYSPLPDDVYDCVVSFRERIFWISPTSCVFSMRNNAFAYPLRNSVSAPTGEFRGALVHAYPGQAEQDSRIVIFGSKETYIGRFTGRYQNYPVTIGTTTYTYPLEGSDFQVDTWTSVTAFSHRSAVVAEGILYWWGPEGIYKDVGRDLPVK